MAEINLTPRGHQKESVWLAVNGSQTLFAGGPGLESLRQKGSPSSRQGKGHRRTAAADAVAGGLKGGGRRLVRRHDARGIPHTGLAMKGTGNARAVHTRGPAGPADLMVGGQAAVPSGQPCSFHRALSSCSSTMRR